MKLNLFILPVLVSIAIGPNVLFGEPHSEELKKWGSSQAGSSHLDEFNRHWSSTPRQVINELNEQKKVAAAEENLNRQNREAPTLAEIEVRLKRLESAKKAAANMEAGDPNRAKKLAQITEELNRLKSDLKRAEGKELELREKFNRITDQDRRNKFFDDIVQSRSKTAGWENKSLKDLQDLQNASFRKSQSGDSFDSNLGSALLRVLDPIIAKKANQEARRDPDSAVFRSQSPTGEVTLKGSIEESTVSPHDPFVVNSQKLLESVTSRLNELSGRTGN